jgi:phosphatidylglycerol:prolipoprotein diacylglycerol transferase
MLALFQDVFAPPRHLILLVIASWVGLLLAESRANRHGLKQENINSLAFHGIIGFVIGGRLLFVLQNLSAFSKSPLSLVAINPDLFDTSAGLAVTLLIALIYGQRHQLSAWSVLDAFTPFFAIMSIGLGLSHLAAGTAFGLPTQAPWAIDLWNAKRHPTQMYETLASTLTFVLIWSKRQSLRPGLNFLIFTACTAGWQMFLFTFRADGALVFNGFHREQVLAWLVLALCFGLIEWRLTAPLKSHPTQQKTA